MENPFSSLQEQLIEIKGLVVDLREIIHLNTVQTTSPQNNLGTIEWFANSTGKAVATVYSDHTNGKIPKHLIHKPAGTKRLHFYKDRVLKWIEAGCPVNSSTMVNAE